MDKTKIPISKALVGYMLAANARRLSRATLTEYAATFRKFTAFLDGDPPLSAITADDIRDLINHHDHLSNKSLLNLHTGLSALWTWALAEGLVERNIVRDVTPPKPEIREVVPFSEQDIKGLLAACERTAGYTRPGQRPCDNARPSALRDRAIIMLLVDTGMRATELCEIRVYQADLKNQHILIFGKGSKERLVPISPRTGQAIWKYLATRDNPPSAGPVFISRTGRPFDRQSLRHLMDRIGKRAGVPNTHPHRFRHTFAINFLRNRGNVYALQAILGHSTMEMVKRYLAIAQVDIQTAHRDASPVSNWFL